MANVVSGFQPCWLEGQQNAGLGIWVNTGRINGILVNGQKVFVPAAATTQVWVTASGLVQVGASVPGGSYAIATVVSGTVVTGGNTPAGLTGSLGKWAGLTTDNGILSITDVRT